MAIYCIEKNTFEISKPSRTIQINYNAQYNTSIYSVIEKKEILYAFSNYTFA